jgi:hypothetical protein
MRKSLYLIVLVLFMALPAFGQNAQLNTIVLGPTGRPLAGATVTICSNVSELGIPCTTTINIFDSTGAGISNPQTTDGRGNLNFWAPPGTYLMTVSGAGITPYRLVISLPCVVGGTGCGGGGGGGTVGPGTPNILAKFTSPNTVGNSTCSDDGINPTRCPDGVDSAVLGFYAEWTVDTGGVTANKLVCRSGSNKAVICPAGTTQGVLGVAQSTQTVGNTVEVCFAGKCNVIAANNFAAGDWLIPSASVAGDVDDTGSTTKPTTGVQTLPAETTGTAGQAVLTTFLSPDTINGVSSLNGTILACTQYGVAYFSAPGTSSTLNCIPSPTANGTYFLNWPITANVAAQPVASLLGLANRIVSGTTDTILYSDRIQKITYTSASAVAVTVPQANSTGFTINTAFRTKVTGVGIVTFTPTTSTVNGQATFKQSQGQTCTWYSDNSNYTTDCWDGKRDCSIVIGADNAASVLVNGDIGPQGSQCYVDNAGTVIEVEVKGDAGTSTALPRKEHGVTNTSLLSGALSTAAAGAIACSNAGGTLGLDGVTTCTNTLNTTALAQGDFIGMASGVADGTTKRLTVHIVWIESGT